MKEIIARIEESMVARPLYWREGPCCFVLSTGRCGTATIAALANLSPSVDGYHERSPSYSWMLNPFYHNAEAWDCQSEFMLGTYMARVQLVHQSVAAGQIYFESNHFLTFFAKALNELFSGVKFIHLIRHPGAFVRSGLRRGWKGPLTPRSGDCITECWPFMNRREQIAWGWNEINASIENFKATISPDDCLTVRAEDMFEGELVDTIYDFMGAERPPDAEIFDVLGKKMNAQTSGDVPPYCQWDRELQQQVMAYAPLGSEYGYEMLGESADA